MKEIAGKMKEGLFDFIELFAYKESFDETHKELYNLFKGEKITIHASHGSFGFDTGNKDNFKENVKQFNEAQKFADMFNSEIIVTHPGFDNSEKIVAETIRQFKFFNDKRIAVENLPARCFDTGRMLHGITPIEIKNIKDETGCKFCLDFSHAICAANHLKVDIYSALDEYYKLNPDVYHICDGLWNGDEDLHLHIGKGDYPIKELLVKYTKENSMLTLETGGYPESLTPWIDDIKNLKEML